MINKKDLQTIKTELIFNGLLFKQLIGIKFLFNNEEIAKLEVVKNSKSTRLFNITTIKNELIKLEGTDKYGITFNIHDVNKEWTYHNPTKILSFTQNNSYKSDNQEITFKYNGFGLMFRDQNKFIGRIQTTQTNIFSKPSYDIDFIDFKVINFLMANCGIEIIQRYIYRLYETGD